MKRILMATTVAVALAGTAIPGHAAAQAPANTKASCIGLASSSLAYGQTGNVLDIGERAEIAHDIKGRLIGELGLPTPGAFVSSVARQRSGSVDACVGDH